MKKKWLSAICLTLVIVFLFSMSFSTTVRADGQDIEGFVTRMYRVVLGREPEAAGLQDWSERLRSGNSCAADIVLGFFFSPEYESKAKSYGEIVTDFYSAMLDRTPDSAGYNDWVKHLDVGMTKTAIAYGFVGSQEFGNLCASYGINPGTVVPNCKRDINFERTYFVYRLYQNCLGRAPEEAGLESWCGNLDEGGTGSNIAYGFIFSNEYRGKNATNAEYVDMLYRTILGREADEAGRASWIVQLDSGYSREHVLNGFLFSTEFRRQCETAQINVGEPIAEPDNRNVNPDESGANTYECKGYIYENSYATSYYYIIKNTGNRTVALDGNAIAYDASGNRLGADSDSISVLGPGETSIMTFYFSNVRGVDSVNCTLSDTARLYYQPVISNLSVNPSRNNRNLTLSITNNGSINADFVEARALFFNESGKVVDSESKFFIDSDNEIKPGATITGQMTSNKNFSRVEYYLIGRSDGQSTPINETVTERDFSVVEYLYESSGSSSYYLGITNNSSQTVGLSINMTAYDGNGRTIGAADGDITVLGSGETSIASFYFAHVTGIDHVSYTMSIDTTPSYVSVLKNLLIDESVNGKNVIISVKNNGSINADFVEARVLFFNESGKVVDSESKFFIDSDNEIKPGATITGQMTSNKNFSRVEYYLIGRSDGQSTPINETVTERDFSIVEYPYESLNSSSYYLGITNNSSQSVGLSINMTAYDSNGRTIGAADGDVTVLGSGETSIASFYFANVTGIDHVSYAMSIDTTPSYAPVLKDLSIDESINGKNVIISVKNNGSYSADFVEAYVLFFDNSGKVVDSESKFFIDSDNEIKPGANITEQISTYKTFSTVKCYYTGRATK